MEKFGYHIHNDLALSILLKLPLKSLKRFNCVCKSWSQLFENPNFMSMYWSNFITSNHSSYQDVLFLLIPKTNENKHPGLYSLSGERYENKVKLDWPPPFQEDDRGMGMMGTVINGIVCLYQCRMPNVVLWNPTTEEFKVIPPSPTETPVIYEDECFEYHGFGYDLVRDDRGLNFTLLGLYLALSILLERGKMVIYSLEEKMVK
ncbi:putative F-box protein At3g16210 [Cicer arietinum]|uniref:F-box protein At3g16210 n=1 Tax=Cicer arietinum TaxID=3827 RepID=A0A1S2YMI7_CICAR|nr:putative F-box protein At3g16210 [Cicer arietinum]